MLASRCKSSLERYYCKRKISEELEQIQDTIRKDQATDRPKERRAARYPNAYRLALERRSEHVHNSSKHSAIFLTAKTIRWNVKQV